MNYLDQQQAERRHAAYIAKRIASLTESIKLRQPDADAVAAADALAAQRRAAHASRQLIAHERAVQRMAGRRAQGLSTHARHLAKQQERKRQRQAVAALAARGVAAAAAPAREQT